jgi:glycosyltransferase involved in cell wall biosynthesis
LTSRPIFINGRFLRQRLTGTQRYAYELLENIDSLLDASPAPRPAVTMLVPSSGGELPSYRNLKVTRVGRYGGRIWEQAELPFYARGGVLFTPCGGAPVAHRRNIITIHDAAVFAAPSGYSKGFLLWYRFLYRVMCRTALHVFTVSEFSRAELIKWCGIRPEKISVTYLGSEHALRPQPEGAVLAKNHLERFKYVLGVGSRNPNKNIAGLLRAVPLLAGSGFELALAGGSNSKVFGDAAVSGEEVRDLGYVNDSELRTLYENAACFVFPSFYEGFGLPPLEALALGCPTVVANSASLTEIFEPIAFLCNPADPADIADKIKAACRAGETDRLAYRRFASSFRWAECAIITWKVISRISEI